MASGYYSSSAATGWPNSSYEPDRTSPPPPPLPLSSFFFPSPPVATDHNRAAATDSTETSAWNHLYTYPCFKIGLGFGGEEHMKLIMDKFTRSAEFKKLICATSSVDDDDDDEYFLLSRDLRAFLHLLGGKKTMGSFLKTFREGVFKGGREDDDQDFLNAAFFAEGGEGAEGGHPMDYNSDYEIASAGGSSRMADSDDDDEYGAAGASHDAPPPLRKIARAKKPPWFYVLVNTKNSAGQECQKYISFTGQIRDNRFSEGTRERVCAWYVQYQDEHKGRRDDEEGGMQMEQQFTFDDIDSLCTRLAVQQDHIVELHFFMLFMQLLGTLVDSIGGPSDIDVKSIYCLINSLLDAGLDKLSAGGERTDAASSAAFSDPFADSSSSASSPSPMLTSSFSEDSFSMFVAPSIVDDIFKASWDVALNEAELNERRKALKDKLEQPNSPDIIDVEAMARRMQDAYIQRRAGGQPSPPQQPHDMTMGETSSSSPIATAADSSEFLGKADDTAYDELLLAVIFVLLNSLEDNWALLLAADNGKKKDAMRVLAFVRTMCVEHFDTKKKKQQPQQQQQQQQNQSRAGGGGAADEKVNMVGEDGDDIMSEFCSVFSNSASLEGVEVDGSVRRRASTGTTESSRRSSVGMLLDLEGRERKSSAGIDTSRQEDASMADMREHQYDDDDDDDDDDDENKVDENKVDENEDGANYYIPSRKAFETKASMLKFAYVGVQPFYLKVVRAMLSMCKSAKLMARDTSVAAELKDACSRVADLLTVLSTSLVLIMSESRSDPQIDRRDHATTICSQLIAEEFKRKEPFAKTDVREWEKKVPVRAPLLLRFKKNFFKKTTSEDAAQGKKNYQSKKDFRSTWYKQSFGDVPKKLGKAVTALEALLEKFEPPHADDVEEGGSSDDDEVLWEDEEEDEEDLSPKRAPIKQEKCWSRFEQMLATLTDAARDASKEEKVAGKISGGKKKETSHQQHDPMKVGKQPPDPLLRRMKMEMGAATMHLSDPREEGWEERYWAGEEAKWKRDDQVKDERKKLRKAGIRANPNRARRLKRAKTLADLEPLNPRRNMLEGNGSDDDMDIIIAAKKKEKVVLSPEVIAATKITRKEATAWVIAQIESRGEGTNRAGVIREAELKFGVQVSSGTVSSHFTPRYRPEQSNSSTRGALWNDAEKALLLEGLAQFGRNWEAIAATIPRRTALQVRTRGVTEIKKNPNLSTSSAWGWSDTSRVKQSAKVKELWATGDRLGWSGGGGGGGGL